jgi:HEAT repeats
MPDPLQPEPPPIPDSTNAPSATAAASQACVPPAAPAKSWATGNGPVIIFMSVAIPVLIVLSFLGAWGIRRAGKDVSIAAAEAKESAKPLVAAESAPAGQAVDPEAQNEAEALLARVAGGDAVAAQQVIAESDGWTGRTRRTPRTDQWITASLNSKDFDVRGAAVAAQLAFDGVPRNESGVAMLERAVGNPNGRAWALWMLGALANRGVDPVHVAKIIGSYLDDPNPSTRAVAVDGLALVGTDETVPMLLDRFRNDPSPIVQERAACDISEAGMYTHAQRMVAAASLVGWIDDSLLSAQQRTWAAQALTDISGKNFGPNSSALKSWLTQQSSQN